MMKAQRHATKDRAPKSNSKFQVEATKGGTANLENNHPDSVIQGKFRESLLGGASPNTFRIQPKANRAGLPNNLKYLSGLAMDDVKVHYNSSKPAQLKALAYAQGSDIHLAPGQEKHLPHEAWHVVQQKQGRVQPTRQLKSTVAINDDVGLEKEADVMGAKALNEGGTVQQKALSEGRTGQGVVQREGEKMVVNLVFAGSGHDFITSDRDPAKEESGFQDSAKDWEQEEGVFVRKMKESSPEEGITELVYEIAGPGSPISGGDGLKGKFDKGSNRIGKLKEVIPEWMGRLEDLEDKEVEFNIWGHSRGGVAGAYVVEKLREKFPNAFISYAGYDPVPGPAYVSGGTKVDLSVADRSAVVYSMASGTNVNSVALPVMRPKPLTPKVLILTATQHSTNLKGTFKYHNATYKESEISTLPPGVYYESSIELAARPEGIEEKDWKEGRAFTFGAITLRRLKDIRNLNRVMKTLQKKNKAAMIDFGRTAIIKGAVRSVMEANRTPEPQ